MIFADLLPGDSVFVDANVFVYHFQPHPQWGAFCSQLLERIENKELLGFTSTHVLGELTHRLMTLEACSVFGWPYAGVANRLRHHPLEVQKLTGFRLALEKLLQSSLQMLTVSPLVLAKAVEISQQIGMLTNDAIIVATMEMNGLKKLVSSDDDFDRVLSLQRYSPG